MTNTDTATATITLRYNKTSVHIDGLDTRTTGGGNDTGRGYVTYAAQSACPALTRGAIRMGYVKMAVRNRETGDVESVDTWATPAEALAAAELYGGTRRVKVCQHCANAARAAA